MKSIYDYDFLQNEVFYRSQHILKYLERTKDISSLDKEAIANTILDALVYKGLIDPASQSLDMNTLSIMDDLDHITYDKTPNITSIPASIKEAMRHKCIRISAGIPIAIFCAKPGSETHTCIYDMNSSFSSLFPTFRFLLCDYDSPTREGVRATERPFVEVNINGEDYLVDTLTKRILKTSWFEKAYNMQIHYEVTPETFDEEQRKQYSKKTAPNEQLASYLAIMEIFHEVYTHNPKMEETLFEIEKSRENFPEAFIELAEMKADMQRIKFIE